jgi:hypothetical protein
MPVSYYEAEQPALILCGAGWYPARDPGVPRQPAPAGPFTEGSGGLPTRRRLPTCPTISAGFPVLGKLSGIGHFCRPTRRHPCRRGLRGCATIASTPRKPLRRLNSLVINLKHLSGYAFETRLISIREEV